MLALVLLAAGSSRSRRSINSPRPRRPRRTTRITRTQAGENLFPARDASGTSWLPDRRRCMPDTRVLEAGS